MRKNSSVEILTKSIATKTNKVLANIEYKPLLILMLVLLPCSYVNATQIDIAYSGLINRLFYAECLSYNSSSSCNSWKSTDVTESFFYEGLGISEEETFSGTFSYDLNASITGFSSDGDSAIYLDAVTSFDFSTTKFTLPSSTLPTASIGGDLVVQNDGAYADSFFISNWFSSSSWFATINIMLMDRNKTVFDDLSIPSSFNLNDFETLYFRMSFLRREDGDQLHLSGYLSDFSVVPIAPVPEPTTILLFGTGLIGLIGSRLKRK